jgi:hypothetical protein
VEVFGFGEWFNMLAALSIIVQMSYAGVLCFRSSKRLLDVVAGQSMAGVRYIHQAARNRESVVQMIASQATAKRQDHPETDT